MDNKYIGKDRKRSEKEKLREMSIGEKAAYIWSYYNYHIIGGIAAAAVIISIAYSCSTRTETGLFVVWSANYLEHEEVEALKEKINERLFDHTSNETAEISLFFTNEDDPAFMINYYNRLMAMLTAGSIDVFIADMETMTSMSSREFIWPLDIVMNDIKVSDTALYEKIDNEASGILFGLDENNQTIEIMGIRVTDSPLIKALGYNMDRDIFFCMAISTQNPGRVTETLKLFFEIS